MTTAAPYTASVHIDADPERVFDHFTRPDAIVRWMGDYAALDPTPGGQFTLDLNGVPVRGRYLAVDRPRRLLLSWGHAGSERLPPGASTVEVTLTPHHGGTTVTIVHAGLPAPEDRQHRLGWPHFLERLVIAATGGDPDPDPWADRSPEARAATTLWHESGHPPAHAPAQAQRSATTTRTSAGQPAGTPRSGAGSPRIPWVELRSATCSTPNTLVSNDGRMREAALELLGAMPASVGPGRRRYGAGNL